MTQDIVTLLQLVNRELGIVFLRCKITLESKPEKNHSWNRVEKTVARLEKINTDCKRQTENSRLNHPRCVMGKTAFLKWYYDQKIISFFSSDFESVFA